MQHYGVLDIQFEAYISSGKVEINRIVWKTASILTVVVGIVCLTISVFAEPIVEFVYSFGPLSNVRQIVILLALAHFISAASFAFDTGLMVVRRPDINFAAVLAQGAPQRPGE